MFSILGKNLNHAVKGFMFHKPPNNGTQRARRTVPLVTVVR